MRLLLARPGAAPFIGALQYGSFALIAEEVSGTTLVIDDLTVASVLDAPAITQEHNLVVNDLTSNTVIDGMVITQVHNLIIDELISNTTIDGVVITQIHQLVIDDLIAATTIDNLVVNSAASLVIQDLNTDSVIDGVSITQVHNLVIDDLASITTLDPLALTQVHNLIIGDLTVTSILDSVVVTQIHQLSIDDLTVIVTIGVVGMGEVDYGTFATVLETTTVSKYYQTERGDHWVGTDDVDFWFGTERPDWPEMETERLDPWIGIEWPSRWHQHIRPVNWFITVFAREEDIVVLNSVEYGPLTQGEIPEPLMVHVFERRRNGTSTEKELFGQTPEWSATVHIEKPDGSNLTPRTAEIMDPDDLIVDYPEDFTGPEDGWVRVAWQSGDFDIVGNYKVQIELDNGTLRLKSVDVWEPEVNDGPAAAVGG